jgi:hypothetical protein
MAMSTNTTIELLLEIVFSTRSVENGYKKKETGATSQVSSAREAEKRWRYC